MTGQSWLLGGGYPWRTQDLGRDPVGGEGAVVANDRDGLTLAPLASGPWGLGAEDGSLGGLTLPRGVAAWGDVVLTLTNGGDRILRYDPVRMTALPLSEVGLEGLRVPAAPGAHLEPRRFRRAASIALFESWLYVADPEAQRVQVLDVNTFALVRLHAGLRDPVDVVAGADGVYILERHGGLVLRDHPAQAALHVVVRAPYRAKRWDRLALDRTGRLYLRDGGGAAPSLDVFDVPPPHGAATPLTRVASPAVVRDRFAPPAVTSGPAGCLVLTAPLCDPCGLRLGDTAADLAWTAGPLRYVIDRNARVVRVHLSDGRVRHRFGPYDAAGAQVTADAPDAWRPVDGVVLDGRMLILDARHQQVHEHRAGDGTLRRRFAAPAAHPRQWVRIASDGRGCLLLWDGGAIVDRLDQRGRFLGTSAASASAPHFDRGSHEPGAPAAFCLTRDGVVRRDPATPHWPAPAYERRGLWLSRWLDSGIYDCQWDVLRLTLSALPPGSKVTVRTRTTGTVSGAGQPSAPLDAVAALGSWSHGATLGGEAQPASDTSSPPPPSDLLVGSARGQYLQLLVELWSDGTRVPVVANIRAHFPRDSWLQYLPAVFSQPDDQQQFLDRYLSIVRATWNRIEQDVESFERYLDPRSVPEEALPYLASWLDLQLEGSLTPAQNRHLLQALPDLWRHWGTVAGLRAWVRVHLAVLTGLTPEVIASAGVPGIVERFVDRRHVVLPPGGADPAAAPAALWSPAIERRFQVGVFDREGDVELVSTGTPDTDVFRHYAHAFRVVVPAAWAATPAAVALLERAIDLQRPAHATFSLERVEPRFRIGVQSTLDLDAVVGGDTTWRLPRGDGDDGAGGGRLGFDAIVGGTRPASWAGSMLG